MDKSSSREGFWGGGGRTSSIKEIWKQGRQACLEKEQVVLTGWSMGVQGGGQEHGFVSYISWVWAQGEEL